MTMILVLRGIPGSGKSTYAKAWVAEHEQSRARVNRDDLRMQLFGRYAGLSGSEEDAVTAAQMAAVRALIRSGRSVVVDDTNVRARVVRKFLDIAVEAGVGWAIKDFRTDLDECLRRNAARDRHVPEDVIRKMHKSADWSNVEPTPGLEVVPYVPDVSLPKAFLFDIDGTLAQMNGRSPYDYSRVGEDLVEEAVATMASDLWSAGYKIIIMSGREDSCMDATEAWLDKHGIPFTEMHMRKSGDMRKDSIIKSELFSRVRDRYNVVGVFDDRDQVVAAWRQMGLKTYQVNYGDF